METQNPSISKINLNNKQKKTAGDITIPDLKLYYRAIGIKHHDIGIQQTHLSIESN